MDRHLKSHALLRPTRRELLAAFAVLPVAAPLRQTAPEWQPLWDGRTLDGWKPTDFGGQGEVHIEDGVIILERGNDLTGITWTGPLPPEDRDRYEIEVEAARLAGGDFFCGLTFPVRDTHCSFIAGGWAGALSGFSTLDGLDASENETTRIRDFEQGRYYRVRVRVEPERLAAWVDDELFADVKTRGRRIDIRPEVAPSRPLGIASWRTRAGIRGIRRRRLAG